MSKPVALLAVLVGTGCTTGENAGTHRDGSPEPPADLSIAVGARVRLDIENCHRPYDETTVCIDSYSEEVDTVTTTGDAFTFGPYTPDGALNGTMEVEAVHLGDSTIVVTYKNGSRPPRIRTLRAVRITDTDLSVGCENGWKPEPYLVAPGASFSFAVQAMSGSIEIASGELELVSAPDFTLGPSPTVRSDFLATAPLVPGPYTWTLAGGRTVPFLVFDASTLGLSLTAAQDAQGVTAVTVQTKFATTPICVGGSGVGLGIVEVTQGGCLPLIGGVEIVGPMPVDLKSALTFNLSTPTPAACTVAVSLNGAALGTGTFDAQPAPVNRTISESDGLPIPSSGVTFTAKPARVNDCNDSLSDGNCDGIVDEYPLLPPLDGDCYLDSEWAIEQRDGTGDANDIIGEDDLIGVGLATELRMRIQGEFLGQETITIGPPIHPTYSLIPEGKVELEELGCSMDGDGLVLKVTPLASAYTQVFLRADNLDDSAWVTIRATAVDRMKVPGLPPPTVSPSTESARPDCFVGSEITLGPVAFEGQGKTLRGVTPVTITSNSPTALLRSWRLYTGSTPGTTVTVAAPAVEQSQVFQVVDSSAISKISGLSDTTITSALETCLNLVPTSSHGALCGTPPLRPRLTISGTAFAIGRSEYMSNLCLRGIAAGKSSFSASWGNARAEATWTYAPSR